MLLRAYLMAMRNQQNKGETRLERMQ